MKRAKKPSVAQEFLDVFADVIADRVAGKLAETASPQPTPQWAPKWLPGPKKPHVRRDPAEYKGLDPESHAEMCLRDAGFLTSADPGYHEALKEYLERKQKHDAELERNRTVRTVVTT